MSRLLNFIKKLIAPSSAKRHRPYSLPACDKLLDHKDWESVYGRQNECGVCGKKITFGSVTCIRNLDDGGVEAGIYKKGLCFNEHPTLIKVMQWTSHTT